MINHRDFLQYSVQNMDRALDLFEKGDYRYSIFSAHESLELCLKAYLLKLKIIKDPKDAGHLPYPAIFKKLAEDFRKEARNPSGITDKNFWLVALVHIDNIDDVFDKIKNYETRKAIWKYSLDITLNDREKSIFKNIISKLQSSFKDQVDTFGDWLYSDKVTQKINNPNSPPVIKQMGSILKKYHEISKNQSQPDISIMGDELFTAAKPALDKSSNLLTEEITNSVMRQFSLLKTMNWMPMMVFSFSHQQISRYPTDIDMNTAEELYQKHKDGVKQFLIKIKQTCDTIKESM